MNVSQTIHFKESGEYMDYLFKDNSITLTIEQEAKQMNYDRRIKKVF